MLLIPSPSLWTLNASQVNYLSERFLQERSCVAIKDDLNYNPTSKRGRQFYNRSNDNFLGAALAVGGDGDVLTCAPRARSNSYGEYKAWLPDGYSQIFRSYVFGPSGFWTMAPLRCKI